MRQSINKKKAFIWGLVAYLINMVVGNLLYMNPIVMELYGQYGDHPSIKPMSAFGGMANWLITNSLFSTVFMTAVIILFIVLYQSLPGKGWIKGLSFGFIIILIKAIPEAFNQFMLFVYPIELILIQLINSSISIPIFLIVLALFYSKFKVIESTKEANNGTR